MELNFFLEYPFQEVRYQPGTGRINDIRYPPIKAIVRATSSRAETTNLSPPRPNSNETSDRHNTA